MVLRGPLSVFTSSLMAIPLAYVLNQLSAMKDPVFILIAGISALCFVVFVPLFVVRNRPQRADKFFYVLGIFTFSSVIDLVIALENDGIIANFMAFYLRFGEPYLKTAHGTMISYWDGIAHYAMYLMMLAAQTWNQSYRDVGIYWVGSIGHSMLILMPGIFIGPHGMRWPCLLNLPYIILPFYYGAKLLSQGYHEDETGVTTNSQPVTARPSIWKRPFDLFFLVYFVAASFLAVLRFIAALGGEVPLAQSYLANFEPYLGDTSNFSKVQMMVYLFYFMPYYCAAIYGLLWPGHTWMLDWSMLFAGASAQGQFAHIGSSFHYRTPFSYRVPQNGRARLAFWLINGSLFIVPQIFAYRCMNFPSFFTKSATPTQDSTDTAEVVGNKHKKKL